MDTNPLHQIMRPSSVAIVGASNHLDKMGTIEYLNLVNSGFPGEVMPVHPTEKEVFGKKAYPSINDLDHAPDLAVLVVPTSLVPEMLEDFGRLGTRYAVIVTAGFKETGDSGRELEQEIVDIASRYGMRFIGPNCMGIINTELPLNISVMPLKRLNGKLGLASQSGTYVAQTLSYLYDRGVVFSKAISVGNEANIDVVDCLEYLGQDESTKAIALYLECIRRPDRFLEVAKGIDKPIVAQYVGGTQTGARSGSSHTGAMAGPDYVYDGLFEQAGVVRVDTIEELYTIGWALACQPASKGRRVGILTNSGGPGTAIANACDKLGLEVPELSETTQSRIKEYIPPHASARNPIDLTFHIDMTPMTRYIPDILLSSGEVDGLIIHGIMDTGFFSYMMPVLEKALDAKGEDILKAMELKLDRLVEMPWKYDKPIVISTFFGREDHSTRTFHESCIPTFDSPEKTVKAMYALYKYANRRFGSRPVPKEDYLVPEEAKDIMKGLIQTTDSGKIALDEYTAKRILRSYDIPTTKEMLVDSMDSALGAARSIGYPVVLKACSPEIQHKTEKGVVHINIMDESGLKEAFADIRKKVPDSSVLVSEMVKGERELMAGVTYFPGFPPCVMFGLGGIFTEALKDNVFRVAPLSEDDARSMLTSISASNILGSYRGMDPVDSDALASILVKLGYVSLHFPEIKEIDLNPIIISGERPVVADALFVVEAWNGG